MIDKENINKFIEQISILSIGESEFAEHLDEYTSEWTAMFESNFSDEEKAEFEKIDDTENRAMFIVSFIEEKMDSEDKQHFGEKIKIDSEDRAFFMSSCLNDTELILNIIKSSEVSINDQNENAANNLFLLEVFIVSLERDILINLIKQKDDIIKYLDDFSKMKILEVLVEEPEENNDLMYKLLDSMSEKQIELYISDSKTSSDARMYMAKNISAAERTKMLESHQSPKYDYMWQDLLDVMTDDEKMDLVLSKKIIHYGCLDQVLESVDADKIEEVVDQHKVQDLYLLNRLVDAIERNRRIKELKERVNVFLGEKHDKEMLDLPEEMTIGVELETVGIALDLKFIQSVLKENKRKKNIKDWDAHWDGSCGPEVVSPILNPTNEPMGELRNIANFMKSMGLTIDGNCGGHVHIGAKYLEIFDENGNSDHGRVALRNLMNIWQEAEEIIYKMSNGEGKVTRKKALKQYAKGEANVIGSSIKKATYEEFEDVVETIQMDRFYGLNLDNLKVGRKNTVEYRASNGTLEIEEIRQNIFLYGRMMVVAKEMVLEPEKYTQKIEQFERRDLTEAEKVETFLNLIFEKEKQRDIYRRRWESVRDDPVYKELATFPPRFKRGDYTLREEFQVKAEGNFNSNSRDTDDDDSR